MTFMRHMRFGQGDVEGCPSIGDAGVQLAVLRVDWRLDLGGIGSAGLRSLERDSGREVSAHSYRQLIDKPPAKAEPDGADFAGAVGAGLQPHCRGEKIFCHLAAIELREQ